MHAVAPSLPVFWAVQGKARILSPARGSPSDADDAECVRRALGGDPRAEELLYRRHVRAVATTVTRLLSRSNEAEDVVQETFLTAFRDLRQLRKVESFRSWLLQIAVRIVHRRFRRRALLRSLGLDRTPDDATLTSEIDPAASPEMRAELMALDDVLRALPAPERIAWVLRHVEGYLLEEIAAACRCSLATAKARIARAQRRIAVHVAFDDGEGR